MLLRKTIPSQGQVPISCPWQSEGLRWELINGQSLIPEPQKGGRQQAKKTWERFLEQGLVDYIKSISSPNTAFEGCSRISPYLTLRGQSVTNFNRQFDGLRESEWSEERFLAWCKGETGFPMIDACMRALHRHGWINFRMRAMLMSFASYQLWLDWRRPAQFLAKYFLDFEPGIHYGQVQMQSGVTGINTVRIYSPSKQQRDQDPDGSLIRHHVPELARLNPNDLANPSEMPPLLELQLGYPVESFKRAQQRIFEWRGRSKVQRASLEVYQRHGSRKNQEQRKRVIPS